MPQQIGLFICIAGRLLHKHACSLAFVGKKKLFIFLIALSWALEPILFSWKVENKLDFCAAPPPYLTR